MSDGTKTDFRNDMQNGIIQYNGIAGPVKSSFLRQYESPLGGIIIAAEGESVTALWFDGQKYAPDAGRGREGSLPVLEEAAHWLDIYFCGRDPGRPPRLAWRGTPFQRAVWSVLLTISYGQTMTYGQIAARLAEQMGRTRMSAQAVGGAVGRNPISLMIPCHRVIGADGSLTGYAGGLERKERLLRLEGIL